MSKNNTIKRSDKKFIRLEKARIRATVLDIRQHKVLIDELYKRFDKNIKVQEAQKAEVKQPAKSEKPKFEKTKKAVKPKKQQ